MSCRRAAPLAVLVLALLAVVGACGIPRDGEPRVIADETTVPAPTVDDGSGGAVATVVLVVSETNELAARPRPVDGSVTPAVALDALLLELSDEELNEGLSTFIPPTTAAVSVEEVDDVWSVDMTADWGELVGQNALYAYAQVVLTLTRLPGVDQVRFSVDGTPVADAPTDNQGNREVLSAGDYETLAFAS